MEPFQLPPHLEKFAGPKVAPPAKMMTAKGMAPLQPRDLMTCVYAMTLDTDPVIVETAQKTIQNYPENILKTAVDAALPVQVMDFIARQTKHQTVIEAITLHKDVHDVTLCYLAEHGSSHVIDIISNNQIRLLKNPKILDHL